MSQTPAAEDPVQSRPSNAAPQAAVAQAPQPAAPRPNKRQLRDSETAYLAGARKLEGDDLDGAEREFVRALQLDPGNRNYAIAISVVREHRVTELVQKSSKARRAGDAQQAEVLLAAARQIDPQNPIVLEHSEPPIEPAGTGSAVAGAPPAGIQPFELAGPVSLETSSETRSFDLRGLSLDLLRAVARQYGIRTVLDPSIQSKAVRFSLQDVTYDRAMYALMTMTHTFSVPIDEHTVLIAQDDAANRARLDRQVQEIIDVPGATPTKLQDIANVIRNVFNVKDVVVDPGEGRIIVRAPTAVFAPLNRTLEPLLEPGGEVVLDVKLYEVNNSSTVKVGTQLPSQFTAFNVDQAANSIVSQNQPLVQQAIAQGLISSTATNLQIALALIGSGLVQSDLAQNLIGVFGGGALQTGVASSSAGLTFNLARSSSDTRALDDVQLRLSENDGDGATFRAGTRYPVTTSTYSTGISTSASALSNATINGVNVGNLLSQYAGGTTATIPQVSYEDLGLTLTAKRISRSGGRIGMQLDLTIQALAGTGLNNIPVLLNRHFSTSLSVGDGETAMLVSDVSKTETAAMDGIPGLSELPGLHAPTQADTLRASGQLVILVTPHLVRTRERGGAGPRIALELPPSQ